MQERALHYVDGVDGDVEIADGIKLVETEKPESNGRSLNDVQLPADAEEREAEIDSLLVDRVARFLGSHTLQFKVTKDSINDMQRSLEEGKSSHFLSIFMKKILPNKLSNVTLTARKMKCCCKLLLLVSGYDDDPDRIVCPPDSYIQFIHLRLIDSTPHH